MPLVMVLLEKVLVKILNIEFGVKYPTTKCEKIGIWKIGVHTNCKCSGQDTLASLVSIPYTNGYLFQKKNPGLFLTLLSINLLKRSNNSFLVHQNGYLAWANNCPA